MGHDVYLGPGATLLTTRAKIIVGDYVMSGPNLTIITGDHRTDVLDKPMMALTDEDKLPENDQDVVIGERRVDGQQRDAAQGCSCCRPLRDSCGRRCDQGCWARVFHLGRGSGSLSRLAA